MPDAALSRKQGRIALIREYAKARGLTFDPNVIETILDLAAAVTSDLVLYPERDTDRSISHKRLGPNHIALYRTRFPQRAKAELAELAALIRAHQENGRAYAIGDMRNISIDRFAAAVLQSQCPTDWQAKIELALQENPTGETTTYGRNSSGYVRLTDAIGFKMVDRRIFIEIKLGKARLRNRHLSLPRIPETRRLALPGTKIGKLIDKQIFGEAFGEANISAVEQSLETTILHLEPDPIDFAQVISA